MLRDAAFAHAVEHGKHGLNGGEVLLLNDFLEEFLVVLHEFRNAGTNGLFGITLRQPHGDVLEVFADVFGALVGVVLEGTRLGFGGGLLNGLALNGWELVSLS